MEREMKQKESDKMGFDQLPEGCISNIISLTGPVDACGLCLVSQTFKSAADSDTVWDKFLPSDYKSIISSSSSSSTVDSVASKKQLFFTLCRNPILVDDSKKSFWLDKWSGKKCYMIAARDLMIAWGSTPEYWAWINLPNSRFSEAALLNYVWWLDIRGKILTSMLSPATSYVAFLVFDWGERARGFDDYATEVSVGSSGTGFNRSYVLLAPDSRSLQRRVSLPAGINENELQRPKRRGDGWFEIELGEYYNESGEDGELEMSVMEVRALKSGLILQGIEIRPKGVPLMSNCNVRREEEMGGFRSSWMTIIRNWRRW